MAPSGHDPALEKGQAAKNGLAFWLKISADGQLRRLFRVGRSSCGRRRLFVLCASPKAQRTGRNGHNHDCFKNFHLIFRLLSEQVAAVF
jgi:hypothetical protein